MQETIEWFRANPDVFGFFVASIIFVITILLVVFRKIHFLVTLILLLFSLMAGLAIANQHRFFKDPEHKPGQTEVNNSSNPALPSL